MNFRQLFDEEWIAINLQANCEEEVFEQVSAKLEAANLINSGYLNGVKEREKEFPTGLITEFLNIALPHADPIFIKKPFVFITQLNTEISCRQMGDNQEMKVKHLFFLGIKEGSQQVKVLQAFMNLFMSKDFVTEYLAEKNTRKVYQLFINTIKREV